jgi:hypothetical protein
MAYYQLMVLLSGDSTLTAESLADRLGKRFAYDPNVKMVIEDGKDHLLRVQWADWSLRLYFEGEPHVLVESEEIAEHYAASHPERKTIAACKRRLSMSGDDDPNMDHFNDYVFVMEVLESFPGVYLFDPREGSFVGGAA